MPTQIDITERKFFSQFLNDENYSSNLTEFTTNLAGSVIEKLKLTQKVQVQWYANSEAFNTWKVEATRFTRQSGSFKDDGFSVGDEFTYVTGFNSATPVNDFTNGVITAVSDDGLRLDFTGGPPSVLGIAEGDVGIRGTNDITALIYNFGLIKNDDTFNTISKVSDNDQAYYGSAIGEDTGGGRPTTPVTLIKQGSYSDWVTGTATAAYVQDVGFAQEFEITHEFRIVPFFLDGQLSNLQNNILPDLFAGLSTLKYVFDGEFRTVLSNPNTSKSVQDEFNLGSVAWFDQNFNGFENDYSIVSIAYEETVGAAPLDAIQLGVDTKITVKVARTSGSFITAETVGGFISYLPPDTEYTDTTTDLDDNFILDQAYNVVDAVPVSSDFIKNFSAVLNAGDIDVIFEVDYSVDQQKRLSDSSNYLVAIQVGDNTLSAGNSDRVVLLADTNTYVQDNDIPDLMTATMSFYDRNDVIGVDPGASDMVMWNTDGITIQGSFTLDLNKDAFLNNLFLVLVGHNNTTGEDFKIDLYSFPLPMDISVGVQQLNINTTRGYIYTGTDQFNDVIMSLGANVGGVQTYNFQIAQKVLWQDWIDNLNVDGVFYDNTKPNNNLNLKTSNYSDLNDYDIKIALKANVSGTSVLDESGVTDYRFLSPELLTYDYGLDANITPVWGATIETFTVDGLTNLNGAILSGDDTLVKVTYVNSVAPVVSIMSMYSLTKIQGFESLGNDIQEADTITNIDTSSFFKPIAGELKVKMAIVSGDVVTQVLIDGSKIISGNTYTLFARIHDDIPGASKITEGSVAKITEGSDIKIVE